MNEKDEEAFIEAHKEWHDTEHKGQNFGQFMFEKGLNHARSGEAVATVIGRFLGPSKNVMTCIDKDLPLSTKLFTQNKPAVQVTEDLTFEQIEDCFPEEGCYSRNEDGALVVSAQFLHDFANKLIKSRPAAQVNEQLLDALKDLSQVVQERNSLGMDWLNLYSRLLCAFGDVRAAINSAEKLTKGREHGS